MRARLERAHLHDVIHSATILTRSVRHDLLDSATGHHSTDGDTPDPTAQWTEATLRFALWTGVLASPADARLLVWAATQPWFLPRTLSEAHGNEVLAAARAVVEATPDYRADNARDCVTGPPAAEFYTDHPVGNPDPTFADVGAEAGVPSESEDNVYVPMTTATDRLDDLRAERANLEAALTSARAAAHRLVETVDAGELPACSRHRRNHRASRHSPAPRRRAAARGRDRAKHHHHRRRPHGTRAAGTPDVGARPAGGTARPRRRGDARRPAGRAMQPRRRHVHAPRRRRTSPTPSLD